MPLALRTLLIVHAFRPYGPTVHAFVPHELTIYALRPTNRYFVHAFGLTNTSYCPCLLALQKLHAFGLRSVVHTIAASKLCFFNGCALPWPRT